MKNRHLCISIDTLEKFFNDVLSPNKKEDMLSHLSECDKCRYIFASISHTISDNSSHKFEPMEEIEIEKIISNASVLFGNQGRIKSQ